MRWYEKDTLLATQILSFNAIQPSEFLLNTDTYLLCGTVRYTLKTIRTPQQVIDSTIRPGTGKETVAVQIGTGALAQCIEIVLKSMVPGEEAIVTIDVRAMHELRDVLSDNMVLEIELKTVLDAPPHDIIGMSAYPLGFASTLEAVNVKKAAGNACIQAGDANKSVEHYTQGLQLLSTLENLSPSENIEVKRAMVTLHSNLCAAYVTVTATNLAIQHATTVLDILDSVALPNATDWRSKAYFRLGTAYEKAKKYEAALWNYIHAAKIQNNASIHQAVNRVRPLADAEKTQAKSMPS